MQYSLARSEIPFDFILTVSALDSAEHIAGYFQEVITGYGGIYVLAQSEPPPIDQVRPVARARPPLDQLTGAAT
jgi:hypothetical protein